MVAYLLKTDGSEGFHQIVDFLNSSLIKYALIENPTIYTSLIQQFWQTAAANTIDTGEVQITATIDGKVKLVSKASIRRHLKLEDSDGISTLPNTEIFEQLDLIGAAKVLDSGGISAASGGISTASAHAYTRRRRTINTASGGISTAEELVSTAGASMLVSTTDMVDKGKAIMQESEPELTTTKVHEEASSFNVKEWEDIQAIIEADEELALRIQAEEREKYSEVEKARLLVDLIN
nr:hypothetical protein [Tanacetum cinerariifolium]